MGYTVHDHVLHPVDQLVMRDLHGCLVIDKSISHRDICAGMWCLEKCYKQIKTVILQTKRLIHFPELKKSYFNFVL